MEESENPALREQGRKLASQLKATLGDAALAELEKEGVLKREGREIVFGPSAKLR